MSWSPPAVGEITEVEVHSRGDLLNGRSFGLAAAYEKLVGTIHFVLDPEDPVNEAVVDARMRLQAPVVTANGDRIEGPVRYWFRVSSPTEVLSLDVPARGSVPYAVLDPESSAHRLTVREGILDERRLIPRESWSFSRLENGVPLSDASSIYMNGGFEPGMLYEVVYQSRDPRVAGLGYAGVREAISYLRYDAELLGDVERACAFGRSQNGRFLRGFLYEGFNADLRGRSVFDGVIALVAGAVRSGFNRRFIQPSIIEPARFPFSDVEQTDPVTERTDGLLSRARRANVLPKLFLVNTSNEYWTEWKAAAMVHTSIDGNEDLELGATFVSIRSREHNTVPGAFHRCAALA